MKARVRRADHLIALVPTSSSQAEPVANRCFDALVGSEPASTIADTGNSQVVRVPAGGGAPTSLGSFDGPYGMAVDQSGDVFVGLSTGPVDELFAGGGVTNPGGSEPETTARGWRSTPSPGTRRRR